MSRASKHLLIFAASLPLLAPAGLRANVITQTLSSSEAISNFGYTLYTPQVGAGNNQPYIQLFCGIFGGCSDYVNYTEYAGSASVTFSNYNLPVGSELTGAYLSMYDSGSITDTFTGSTNNGPTPSYTSMNIGAASAGSASESLNATGSYGGYLDSAIASNLQAGAPLTVSFDPYAYLYTYNGQWYCSYSTCSATWDDRSLSDSITTTANLYLYYTPDSPPYLTTYGASASTGSEVTMGGSGYSPLGYNLTYSWMFSNGVTLTGLNPTIDLTGPQWAPGQYTATLRAVDPYGYTSTSTTFLTVLAPEPQTIAILALGLGLLGLGRWAKSRR